MRFNVVYSEKDGKVVFIEPAMTNPDSVRRIEGIRCITMEMEHPVEYGNLKVDDIENPKKLVEIGAE